MRGLQGKRVILTGGASGIGRATTLRLATEGCIVGVLDLDEAGAKETARMAEGTVVAYRADISERDQVEAAVHEFEGAHGPVEGLANVAGWDVPMPFLDTDRAFWDKIIRINLYGPLVMHHVVVRGMAERGAGCVVNVSSDAGRVGSSGEAVYSACKGASSPSPRRWRARASHSTRSALARPRRRSSTTSATPRRAAARSLRGLLRPFRCAASASRRTIPAPSPSYFPTTPPS